MKKILVLLVAVVALAGCGGSSNKVSKTCSMEQQGIKFALTGTAKDEKSKLDTVKFDISISYEVAGIDKATLTDESKKEMTTQMESMFAGSVGEDVKVETKFNDKDVSILYSMDAKAWAKDTDMEEADLKINKFTETMKESGFTCK